MGDSQDDVLKAKVGKKLKAYYLGSYINMSVLTNAIEQATQEKAKQDAEAAAAEENGGESY